MPRPTTTRSPSRGPARSSSAPAAAITFNRTLDPAAPNLDAAVGGPNVDVTFAQGAGTLTTLGTLTVPDARNVTINGPVNVAALRQSAGTGTTTLNGPVTATGGGPVTNFAGGAINLQTSKAVLNAAVSAPNAPVVLRLAAGATQPGGSLTTPKLYLGGAGDFNLNQPGNRLTAGQSRGDGELFVSLGGGSVTLWDSTDLFLGFEDPAAPAVTIANGNLTLTTNGNFTAYDPRAADAKNDPARLTRLVDLGTGTAQVYFSVGRAAEGVRGGRLRGRGEGRAVHPGPARRRHEPPGQRDQRRV